MIVALVFFCSVLIAKAVRGLLRRQHRQTQAIQPRHGPILVAGANTDVALLYRSSIDEMITRRVTIDEVVALRTATGR